MFMIPLRVVVPDDKLGLGNALIVLGDLQGARTALSRSLKAALAQGDS